MNKLVIVLCLGLISFQSGTLADLGTFTIEIPDGMVQRTPDSASDELLKLNLNRDLFISIQDNADKAVAESTSSEETKTLELVEFVFKVKFAQLEEAFQGYNPSEKVKSEFNTFEYYAQEFTCGTPSGEEAYLEYRIMQIGGKYYDFIITGRKNLRTGQEDLMEKFWKSIVLKK